MALQLRRGTNAERLALITPPALGELIYVTDYVAAGVAPLFVGDGTTPHGNPVGASSLSFTSIQGNVTPDQDSTRDLGTNTERWANAYVDDITVTNSVTGNVTGDLTGNVIGNVTGNVTGSVSGSVVGHVVGSVFGEDSTQLVDGANATISNINTITMNPGPGTSLNEVYQINVDSQTNQIRIGHTTDDEFGRLTFVRQKAVGTIPQNEGVGRILWTKIENNAETNFGVITTSQNQMVFTVNDGVHNFTKTLRVHKTGKVDINGDLNAEPAAEFSVNGIALLTPQTGAPASPTVGMIAVADGTTWDPASKGGTPDPYPAFYDGNAWVAMA